MADDKFLPKLSQNLLECLEDNEYYDVTIEVGMDPYVKVFRAHMIILNYRSPYLQRVLSTNKKKNDGTLVHIKFPNILPESFHVILRYIYGARLSLEGYDISDIINILLAAGELNIQELITHIQLYLIENEVDRMEKNFNLIYQTSLKHDSFLKLQEFCTNLMLREPEKLFNSVDFVSMTEKTLVTLIQNDKLSMRGIQVWDHVLKWGLAQNPELSSDPSSYSKDDFKTLKNTLQKCIQFIRFRNLASREFLTKVLPYKKALPKELYVDLIKCFLENDYVPGEESKSHLTKDIKRNGSINIDSKIITEKHAELISKWISKIDNKDELKIQYEFKLLLCGSRDGFSSKKFHEICRNQTNTVTIIKIKGSDEILGGYNPIAWKYVLAEYYTTKKSFIFSFKGKENIRNCILSWVKDFDHAIKSFCIYGPSFGQSDLNIYGDAFFDNSCCRRNSYEKEIRETQDYFSVEEYEVFQVKNR